jgi:phosphatidylinositol-3,4,5-trisphosphate 3-phosphatase/dual-specificity protein phosphatase PTEN
MWSAWLFVYHYKQHLPREHLKTICTGLAAASVIMYLFRLVLLGREIRRISRTLVSKKKKRFVDLRHDFDLDLAYISKCIVAMGFPSQSTVEAQFRNSMEEVQRFFTTRHKGHYKVYNLCIERVYTHRCFEQEFHEVRFPDHNPCPLHSLQEICQNMEEFQAANRGSNVVAVHCKAGKGRTGLVISSFLLHTKKCRTAREALEIFGTRRTFNGKGVTIPSQIRYVHHYEKVVGEHGLRVPQWLRLRRLEAIPWFPEDCRIQLVTHEEGLIFDSGAERGSQEPPEPPLLEGDVKVVVFNVTTKLFHFWLHTAYDPVMTSKELPAEGTTLWASNAPVLPGPSWSLVLPRKELDGLHKDKETTGKHSKELLSAVSDFVIRMVFAKPSWDEEHDEQCNRQRLRTQREVDSRRQTMLASTQQHQHAARLSAVDYDAMGNDTDEEEMLSTLHRGYLVRSHGCCSRRSRRWCEITTSGQLHIAGAQLLVVNLAEGEKVCRLAEGFEHAWNVRNPTNGSWVCLEAEAGEGKHWDQAFSDSLRLGVALNDTDTAFCGFFWKLNHDADEEEVANGFEFADWRFRLFVLHGDGKVLVYSWKDRQEQVFVDFATPSARVEKLGFVWRAMPHTVPFQIVEEGKAPRILAARDEDFKAFTAKVSRLRAEIGAADDDPMMGSMDLYGAGGFLTRW